jgi:hypothetical protein
MRGTWLRSAYFTWILLVGTVLVLLVVEATVIVAFAVSPKVHTSLAIGYLLASVLVTSVPGVAGVKGYYVARRLRSAIDAEGEEIIVIWLSRQFLATAVFGYGAVITNVMFMTEVLRLK